MDQRVGRILFPLLGVAAFAAVGLVIPHFLTAANLLNVVRQSSIVGICAVGMTMVIVILGIDLSIAGLIALCPMVSGLLMLQGFPIAISVIAGIIAGIGMGLFNGLMVAKLGVPPFITTLVVGQISQGLALIMNNGHSIGGFPASYVYLGNGSVLGVPVSDLLLIVMMGIGIFITQLTPTGNRIYALGGNETVVRQEGINVDGLKLFVYTFSGFCASIAGILLSAQLDTVHPIQGEPYLLDAIAACVIGGVSLAGGEGRVALAVAGALIIGSLRNVLDLLGVHPFFQNVLVGTIIILVVFASGLSPLETRGARMRRIIRHTLKNGSALILVLLALVGIVFVRNFASLDNGAIIARQSAIPAIAVLGMTMVLMTGGIDLSLGFVVGLASIATGFMAKVWGLPVGLTVAATVLLGSLVGLLNGAIIQYMKVPAVHNHPRDGVHPLRRITTHQRRERDNAPAPFPPGGRPNGPSGAPNIGIHRSRDHRFGLVSRPQVRVRPGAERFRLQPSCRLPERASDCPRQRADLRPVQQPGRACRPPSDHPRERGPAEHGRRNIHLRDHHCGDRRRDEPVRRNWLCDREPLRRSHNEGDRELH